MLQFATRPINLLAVESKIFDSATTIVQRNKECTIEGASGWVEQNNSTINLPEHTHNNTYVQILVVMRGWVAGIAGGEWVKVGNKDKVMSAN